MKNIFTDHPNSVGETYFQHFAFAFGIGFKLIVWGFVAMIHALLPFTFKTYVSKHIHKMYLKINRQADK
ncbi:MAG: DUF6356 family protein [Flavobacteriaceae bacterium]|nr:DUF6356 family protein [Flavobacteriaceae bacterium]MDG2386543.1 DUF6356 family protein [Flavobacteriaceae bacterium]